MLEQQVELASRADLDVSDPRQVLDQDLPLEQLAILDSQPDEVRRLQ